MWTRFEGSADIFRILKTSSHIVTDWEYQEIAMHTVNSQRYKFLSISTVNTMFSMFPGCYELLFAWRLCHMSVPIVIPCNFRFGKWTANLHLSRSTSLPFPSVVHPPTIDGSPFSTLSPQNNINNINNTNNKSLLLTSHPPFIPKCPFPKSSNPSSKTSQLKIPQCLYSPNL